MENETKKDLYVDLKPAKAIKVFCIILIILAIISVLGGLIMSVDSEEWIWLLCGFRTGIFFLICRFILYALSIQVEAACYIKADIEAKYED